jgi:hypothetical protein
MARKNAEPGSLPAPARSPQSRRSNRDTWRGSHRLANTARAPSRSAHPATSGADRGRRSSPLVPVHNRQCGRARDLRATARLACGSRWLTARSPGADIAPKNSAKRPTGGDSIRRMKAISYCITGISTGIRDFNPYSNPSRRSSPIALVIKSMLRPAGPKVVEGTGVPGGTHQPS